MLGTWARLQSNEETPKRLVLFQSSAKTNRIGLAPVLVSVILQDEKFPWNCSL